MNGAWLAGGEVGGRGIWEVGGLGSGVGGDRNKHPCSLSMCSLQTSGRVHKEGIQS